MTGVKKTPAKAIEGSVKESGGIHFDAHAVYTFYYTAE